uniref:Secreted protein n=1 Tax=Plectus sambesii TaxID=2011161 RepID=A0A914XG98_9BILA
MNSILLLLLVVTSIAYAQIDRAEDDAPVDLPQQLRQARAGARINLRFGKRLAMPEQDAGWDTRTETMDASPPAESPFVKN